MTYFADRGAASGFCESVIAGMGADLRMMGCCLQKLVCYLALSLCVCWFLAGFAVFGASGLNRAGRSSELFTLVSCKVRSHPSHIVSVATRPFCPIGPGDTRVRYLQEYTSHHDVRCDLADTSAVCGAEPSQIDLTF